MYVPCGMIHNSQDVEQAKCLLTDKQTKTMQYIIQAYLVFSVSYGLHGWVRKSYPKWSQLVPGCADVEVWKPDELCQESPL